MTVPNETWSMIMNIRILAASTLTLATLAGATLIGVALAEPRNSNWDKCPGGFDSGTTICLSRDKFDRTFPLTTSSSYSGATLPLGNGSRDNPQ
jgi:hypothetical protein